MFVLYDSSGTGVEICGVFSSLEIAEKAMNEIVVAANGYENDLFLHIYQVPIDSFERTTLGWDQVSSFSAENG